MIEINPEKAIQALSGKTPWGVKLGVGSTLTMEFGRKDPRQSSVSVHGEWHLWLYMCSWRIETPNNILVASEDERDRIRGVLKKIDWAEIIQLELRKPGLDLTIGFQGQRELRTFSVNSSDNLDSDQWILFTPELVSVSARGGKLVVEEYAAGAPFPSHR